MRILYLSQQISLRILLPLGIISFGLFPVLNLVLTPAFGSDQKGAQGELISELWYTVTVGKDTPYAYYRDRFERIGDRIRFLNEMWKKEEGFINTESLGAFAKNDSSFTPLFFNYRTVYRSTETLVDGTIENGKVLLIKIRQQEKELPLIRKPLGTPVIFSGFFPLFLGSQMNSLKPKQTRSFTTILEDNIAGDYDLTSGLFWLMDGDETSKETKSFPFRVRFRGYESTWYVDSKGFPVKILIPSRKTTIERKPEAEAKAFLD